MMNDSLMHTVVPRVTKWLDSLYKAIVYGDFFIAISPRLFDCCLRKGRKPQSSILQQLSSKDGLRVVFHPSECRQMHFGSSISYSGTMSCIQMVLSYGHQPTQNHFRIF